MKTLTIVYRDILPGEEALEITSHPKVKAMSWSDPIQQRDVAIDALGTILETSTDHEVIKLVLKTLDQIDDLMVFK